MDATELNATDDIKKLLVALKFRFGEAAITPTPTISNHLAKLLLVDMKEQISRQVKGEEGLVAQLEKQDKLLRKLARIAVQEQTSHSQVRGCFKTLSEIPAWVDCTYKLCMLLAIFIIFCVIVSIYIRFKSWF